MSEATMVSPPAAGTRPRPEAGPTVLAIDFGTTYTTGALAAHGKVMLLELDDGARTPSAVFLPAGGRLVAGVEAMNRAATDPTAFERTPKRRLGHGSILLGGYAVPDADVVAAVIEPVVAEARRQLNGAAPDVACLTHPASWRRARRQVLLDAARKAGLPEPHLRAEPVAAACHYAQQAADAEGAPPAGGLPEGGALAVYDLGGGTFDTAVIGRRAGELTTVGEPGGIDPLGGIDFDHRLLAHLGSALSGEHQSSWSALMSSGDPRWVRSRLRLLDDVRRAKEALSRRPSQPVFVDGLNVDVTVTRDELLALVRADIEQTVATLADTIARAGLRPADLAGVYLVGGSSRMQVVADTVWERLGIRPTTMENPKSVVALGAAAAVRVSLVSTTPSAARPVGGAGPILWGGGPAFAPPARQHGQHGPPARPPGQPGQPGQPDQPARPHGQAAGPGLAPPAGPGDPPPIVEPPGPRGRNRPSLPRRKLTVLGSAALAVATAIGLSMGMVSCDDSEHDLIRALRESASSPCQSAQPADWASKATSVQVCKYSEGHAAEIYTWPTASDASDSLSGWTNGTTPSSWKGGEYVDVEVNGSTPGAYAVYNPDHSILLYGDGTSSPSGELMMSWLKSRA